MTKLPNSARYIKNGKGDKESQTAAQKTCLRTYHDIKSFYDKISKGREDVGFQLLYGPPDFNTPILFLGYQPGRGCKSAVEERTCGNEERWPRRSEYATECWPLAIQSHRIFNENGDLIERCVGMNAIFEDGSGETRTGLPRPILTILLLVLEQVDFRSYERGTSLAAVATSSMGTVRGLSMQYGAALSRDGNIRTSPRQSRWPLFDGGFLERHNLAA
jgi:hypothetical protein